MMVVMVMVFVVFHVRAIVTQNGTSSGAGQVVALPPIRRGVERSVTYAEVMFPASKPSFVAKMDGKFRPLALVEAAGLLGDGLAGQHALHDLDHLRGQGDRT
jgi:hypothetical protein